MDLRPAAASPADTLCSGNRAPAAPLPEAGALLLCPSGSVVVMDAICGGRPGGALATSAGSRGDCGGGGLEHRCEAEYEGSRSESGSSQCSLMPSNQLHRLQSCIHLCLEGRKLQDDTRDRKGNARAQVGAVHEVISNVQQVKQVGQHVSLRYLAQVWHLEVVLRDLRGNV